MSAKKPETQQIKRFETGQEPNLLSAVRANELIMWINALYSDLWTVEPADAGKVLVATNGVAIDLVSLLLMADRLLTRFEKGPVAVSFSIDIGTTTYVSII